LAEISEIKWGELKINGQNIPARSYASISLWNNKLIRYKYAISH